MIEEDTKDALRKIISAEIKRKDGLEWVANSLIDILKEVNSLEREKDFKEVLMLALQVANTSPNLSLLNSVETNEEGNRYQLLDLE